MPALRALAAAFPDRPRLLAAPRALAPLVALIGPDPTRIPTPAERTIGALVPLPAWVGPDARPAAAAAAGLPRGAVAVNLHGRGPESHRLLRAAAPRRLLAFAHPAVPESAGGPPWDAGGVEHETARWCRLLAAYGIAADPRALDLPAPPSARAAAARGATVLHPGAGSPARRWPAERWAEVARGERARGRRVLVTGGPHEAALAADVADRAGLPRAAVLAGRTDLRTLVAVIAAADALVSGDTGVAHLATALRTPSVALFGPTSPAAWGPPPDRPWHRVLWHGRGGDPHGGVTDPGLLAIAPREVLAAIAALPSRPAAPALTAAAAP